MTEPRKNLNLPSLACPVCRGSLQLIAKPEEKILCAACALTYPIISGIPVLIAERAIKATH